MFQAELNYSTIARKTSAKRSVFCEKHVDRHFYYNILQIAISLLLFGNHRIRSQWAPRPRGMMCPK